MPVMVLLLAAAGCSKSDSSGGSAFAANDATLGGLEVSSGTLDPAFDPEVITYAVTVANGTTTFQVTPTAHSPKAYAIQVKQGTGAFTIVPSGAPSPSYNAPAVGSSTTVTVRVIAEDQSTKKAYVIVVTQAAADATLRSLAVAGGNLSPAFASSTFDYTAVVPYGATSFTATPTVNESHATVQAKLNSGTFGAFTSGDTYALTVPATGSASVTFRVTAESGATQDYKITVSQAAPSADATLVALAVSGASLTPGSVAGSYSATLPNGPTTFRVTATASEPHATIQVKQDGVLVGTAATGTTSVDLIAPPAGGATTTVTVLVTAQDGATTGLSTITVDQTMALSADASLQSLSISDGLLSPGFDTGTLNYTAVLPNPTATFTVTPVVSDPTATIQVDQDGVVLASPSALAPPADGTTTVITVHVTAQNGTTTQDYKITVTQAAPSTDATLQALEISPGSLSPAFDGTFQYAGVLPVLPPATVTFTVTPTATEPHATIAVDQDGVPLGGAPWILNAPASGGAPTVIVVHVTAQDGVTTRDYTITVSQAQEVTASFPLTSATDLFTPTGDIFGTQSFAPGASPSGMAYVDYKDGATLPSDWYDLTGSKITGYSPTGLQRSSPSLPAVGWPGEPDMALDRWVQFAVNTSATKTLTVDSISFYGGAGGGTGLRFRVFYSTAADFSGAVELTSMSLNSGTPIKNAMYAKAATGQSIVVPPGDTLYVRIFPWQTSATTSKYLLLQNFKVHGTVY
jgi:hypothetical protein